MDISSANTDWSHCLLLIAGSGSYAYATPDVQVYAFMSSADMNA